MRGRPVGHEYRIHLPKPTSLRAVAVLASSVAKIPAIEHIFYYALPPERVFSALTEPDQLAKWFVEKAVVSPKAGGAFRLTWPGGFSMKGKVRAFERPKKLHLEWRDRFPGKKTFVTEARFSLRKKGKGTLLTITHRGFKSGKSWVALYGGIESGWAYYLTNLRSVLEHGTDLRTKFDALG